MPHFTYIKVFDGTLTLKSGAEIVGCQRIPRKNSGGGNPRTRSYKVTLSLHPVEFEIAVSPIGTNPCDNWPAPGHAGRVLYVRTAANGTWEVIKCRERPRKTTGNTRMSHGRYRVRKHVAGNKLTFERGSIRISF